MSLRYDILLVCQLYIDSSSLRYTLQLFLSRERAMTPLSPITIDSHERSRSFVHDRHVTRAHSSMSTLPSPMQFSEQPTRQDEDGTPTRRPSHLVLLCSSDHAMERKPYLCRERCEGGSGFVLCWSSECEGDQTIHLRAIRMWDSCAWFSWVHFGAAYNLGSTCISRLNEVFRDNVL